MGRRRTAATLVITVAVALLALGGVAAAAGSEARPAPKTTLTDVEREVMCVVCQTPLNVSQAPQADRERAFISRLIARGRTKEQIKDALVAQYGPGVLALPRASGFDLAVYVVPAIAVALGIVLLAIFLPRWRRRTRAAAIAERAAAESAGADGTPRATNGALSHEDLARLDEDLARYDR